MSVSEIKYLSKERFKPFGWSLYLNTFVYALLIGAIEIAGGFVAGIGSIATALFIIGHINISYKMMIIDAYNGNAIFLTPFVSFSDYSMYLKLILRKFLKLLLGFLLLIIPGVIWSFAYSLVEYIQKDNPTWDSKTCMDYSSYLMYGYKGKLFVIYLSYIGWALLNILTLGLLTHYIKARIEMDTYTLYKHLLEEKQGAN